MPRKLTDTEIEAQKEFMYERTVQLILRKGISAITLDDILDAVQMAKGSFYRYYTSKEIFLYEVVKKNERLMFEKLIQAVTKLQQGKENAFEVMSGFLTNEDYLFMSILPEEVENLLRKMPPSYWKQEEEKSRNNFFSFCNAMNIRPTEEFFGALSYLMLPIMLVGRGLEEAGWRYIAFPELDKKFGFTLFALITGIIWAFWHLPLFYIPGVNQYGKNFIGFTVLAIGLSFMLGAIRKVTCYHF